MGRPRSLVKAQEREMTATEHVDQCFREWLDFALRKLRREIAERNAEVEAWSKRKKEKHEQNG